VRLVAVTNHKGGSAKTTTVVSLAAALGELGSRVLVIDMDPQGSATSWLGVTPGDRHTLEAYLDKADLSRISRPTTAHGVDLIASSPYLVAAGRKEEVALSLGVMAALERLPMSWDYVLVDCPPSQVPLSVAPLAVCPDVVIPVEARIMALTGVVSLLGTMDAVRERLNPNLSVLAMLACRVDRSRHAEEVIEHLRAHYPAQVLESVIRDDINLAEAPSFQLPIGRYAPSSTGAADYRAAAEELQRRERQAVGVPRAWTAPAPAFELSAAGRSGAGVSN
jgi:chromosome partitioning protein